MRLAGDATPQALTSRRASRTALSQMASRMSIWAYIRRLRTLMKPEVREWLDGFGVFFAVTLFFCLIAAAHDGIVNRQRMFDERRWWYPIYRLYAR